MCIYNFFNYTPCVSLITFNDLKWYNRLEMTEIGVTGYIIQTLLLFLIFLLLRIIYLVYKTTTSECVLMNSRPLRTLICIGSGGHTMEILSVTGSLNVSKYTPLLFVLADSDTSSEAKIHEAQKRHSGLYQLARIPRSRNVQQSYLSSVKSTLIATWYTIPVLSKFRPHVIFCNGPGTCIPVCMVAFLMRALFLLDCRLVFIESICRVHSLSLTGKILQYFADLFIVQWPELRDVCFRAKYFGRLA